MRTLDFDEAAPYRRPSRPDVSRCPPLVGAFLRGCTRVGVGCVARRARTRWMSPAGTRWMHGHMSTKCVGGAARQRRAPAHCREPATTCAAGGTVCVARSFRRRAGASASRAVRHPTRAGWPLRRRDAVVARWPPWLRAAPVPPAARKVVASPSRWRPRRALRTVVAAACSDASGPSRSAASRVAGCARSRHGAAGRSLREGRLRSWTGLRCARLPTSSRHHTLAGCRDEGPLSRVPILSKSRASRAAAKGTSGVVLVPTH